MTHFLIISILMFASCGQLNSPGAVNSGESPALADANAADVRPPSEEKFNDADGIAVYEATSSEADENGRTVLIYDADGSVWRKIDTRDDSLDSLEGETGDFFPFYFSNGASHDFGIEMRVTGKSADWIRVLVHEKREPRTIRYIRSKDPAFKHLSWEEWVKGHFNLRFDKRSNPVLDSPEGSPTGASIPEDPLIKAGEVRGDWVLIRWTKHEPEEPSVEQIAADHPKNAGWIRWRDDGQILIREFIP